MFGLSDHALSLIHEVLSKFPEADKVVIFGSRAMGNYKKGSDIDLAVFGNNLEPERIIKLNVLLNQKLPIPYYFDVLDYDKIDDASLKEHINNEGKVFYTKNNVNTDGSTAAG